MTAPPPLLITSCPARSIQALQSELRGAAQAGADVAEVRLDRLAPRERLRVADLFPAPLPMLATLRSRAEGGEGPDDSAERAGLIEVAARLPFRFIDLERAHDSALLEPSSRGLVGNAAVIVSSHLPDSTSTSQVRRLLELPRPPGAVGKVVLPCGFDRLWSDLLPGLSPMSSFAPYILHTTGPTGQLLRAWANRLGMFAVFASLPRSSTPAGAPSVEPSQLPVDRLRNFSRAGGSGPLFAVVGHPIEHSRSPDIHAFWMERERRTGLYLALDILTAQELSDSLPPLEAGGFKGVNVTHPWKQVALSLASTASPACEVAQCANTISFGPDAVAAENTDVAAVRRRLTELKELDRWDGSPVVVLGGGGAARSALAALSSLGGSGIVIARRRDVAEALALEYHGRVGLDTPVTPSRLVIHATPAGREECPTLDLPWSEFVDASTHVLDFVYEPAHPFLQERARARGATYEDGARLLVYQAAESYATWWGSAPSLALQEAALEEVLCAA
jgi:shikimate dehydrogenase/3-dehydroquinate dehydratase type I